MNGQPAVLTYQDLPCFGRLGVDSRPSLHALEIAWGHAKAPRTVMVTPAFRGPCSPDIHLGWKQSFEWWKNVEDRTFHATQQKIPCVAHLVAHIPKPWPAMARLPAPAWPLTSHQKSSTGRVEEQWSYLRGLEVELDVEGACCELNISIALYFLQEQFHRVSSSSKLQIIYLNSLASHHQRLQR